MSNMRRIIILITALALLVIPAAASASTWRYHKMNRGEQAGFVSDMRQPQKIQHGGPAWFGPCSKTRGEVARNGQLEYAAFDVKCREAYLIFAKKTLPGKWVALTLGTGGFGYFGMPQGIEKTLMYKLTGYYGLAAKRLKASGQRADNSPNAIHGCRSQPLHGIFGITARNCGVATAVTEAFWRDELRHRAHPIEIQSMRVDGSLWHLMYRLNYHTGHQLYRATSLHRLVRFYIDFG
jgi:hypothetical protein